MSRRVLVGSAAAPDLVGLKLLLEAEGCDVVVVASMDDMLRRARQGDVDLLVVDELLEGGSGTDLCALLDGVPRRPAILYIGAAPVRGADASAPSDDPGAGVETAIALLDRTRVTENPADPTEPHVDGDTLGWAVAPNPLGDVATRDRERTNAGAATTGAELLNALATERIDTLLRRVRESDYYEILGVPVTATPAEIRAAHAARAKVLRDLPRESSGGRGPVEEVKTALDEALDVLGNPALRAAYTRHRLA